MHDIQFTCNGDQQFCDKDVGYSKFKSYKRFIELKLSSVLH